MSFEVYEAVFRNWSKDGSGKGEVLDKLKCKMIFFFIFAGGMKTACRNELI